MQSLNRQHAIVNQVRRLTQGLFISGAFNILLFLALLSLLYLESPLLPFPSHTGGKSVKERVHKPALPDLSTQEPKKPVVVIRQPQKALQEALQVAPQEVVISKVVAAVTHSVPKVETKAPVVAKASKLPCATYVVSEGDSLWKIARKFGVDVATLKQINHLEHDRLKQGMVLSIPTKNPILTHASL